MNYHYHGETESSDGTIRLLANDTIEFWTRSLLGNRRHHWYEKSDILEVKVDSDGFSVSVLCAPTDDEDQEVVQYNYAIDEKEVKTWITALTDSKQTELETPKLVIIREREVIREIVKTKCSHCGIHYDQTEDRCPNCGGT